MPGVVRFELNRSLSGMGHERFASVVDAIGSTPSAALARQLFATGKVDRSTSTATSSRSTSPRATTRQAWPTSCARCTGTGSRASSRRPSRTQPAEEAAAAPCAAAGGDGGGRRGSCRRGPSGARPTARAQPGGVRHAGRPPIQADHRSALALPNICSISVGVVAQLARSHDCHAFIVRARPRSLPAGRRGVRPTAARCRAAARTGVGCSGAAAWSLALGVISRAVGTGSWAAFVGTPTVGLEAASELGVTLARVVLVDVDGSSSVWAERVAAAADGFELIVTCPPVGAERVARRVRQRLQASGVVLLAVSPSTPSLACDVELTSTAVDVGGHRAGSGLSDGAPGHASPSPAARMPRRREARAAAALPQWPDLRARQSADARRTTTTRAHRRARTGASGVNGSASRDRAAAGHPVVPGMADGRRPHADHTCRPPCSTPTA